MKADPAVISDLHYHVAARGNAVTFLMEHENITYPEALKMVAKRYGI